MSDKDVEQIARKEQREAEEDGDFSDMLQELRILLQGAQVLTAFLIILPFNEGFNKINETEKWLYLATFICSLTSLVFFTAPAALHRLARPVHYRVRFKDVATRLITIGLVPASFALVLSSQIVASAVVGEPVSWIVAGLVTVVIGLLWWVIPLLQRDEL